MKSGFIYYKILIMRNWEQKQNLIPQTKPEMEIDYL